MTNLEGAVGATLLQRNARPRSPQPHDHADEDEDEDEGDDDSEEEAPPQKGAKKPKAAEKMEEDSDGGEDDEDDEEDEEDEVSIAAESTFARACIYVPQHATVYSCCRAMLHHTHERVSGTGRTMVKKTRTRMRTKTTTTKRRRNGRTGLAAWWHPRRGEGRRSLWWIWRRLGWRLRR